MHRGLTETETHSFNDSRRLSFTKWASNVRRMPYEVGGGRGRRRGGGLPVGRGSERRILITATRTSSLGNTIWHCHTDACNPVGWSLPLNARFVHFGAAILGFPDVTYCSLFVYVFRLFCFDGQCNYLLLDGGTKVGPVGGFLAELTFAKMHHVRDQRFVFLEWGIFREVDMVWESRAICTKTNSCAKAWLRLLLRRGTGCDIARP